MHMNKKLIFSALFLFGCYCGMAQQVGSTPEYIKMLTSQWKGERFPDGRPKVSDNLLERLKPLSLEDIWGVLRNKGYQNQFEGNWQVINPDSVMTGRVVTAQYMPLRPDLADLIKAEGKAEGRGQHGGTNSWPIDILTEGDIYVADSYEKMADGTLIGDFEEMGIGDRKKLSFAGHVAVGVVLDARFDIIELEGVAIGRIVVHPSKAKAATTATIEALIAICFSPSFESNLSSRFE